MLIIKSTFRKKLLAWSSAAVLAATAGPFMSNLAGFSDIASAQAQTGSGQGGQGGQGGGGAGQGQRGPGTGSDRGQGQRGPSADSDARGPRYQGGTESRRPPQGTRGGRPVWAQEGIPEVELGRLNVARAPTHVLEKAFWEALANFNSTSSATLYSMTAEAFAAYVQANYATVVRIDSPLENLALFQDIRVDSRTQLPGVTPASAIDLAAIFLGSASDKNIPITTNTVLAVNTILRLPTLSAADLQTLAQKADAVRLAILAGHG